ncbi:hypothetical protein [Pseudobowmanella zhangzhouensis]
MLINTLLLFVRDLMPVLMLLVWLLLLRPAAGGWRALSLALLCGVAGSAVLVVYADVITELADGAGMELVFVGLQLGLFVMVLLTLWQPKQMSTGVTMMALAIALMVNGANLIFYLSGYLYAVTSSQSIVLGALLGLGITLSAAILLYALASWLGGRHLPLVAALMLSLFIAGQLAHTSHLLVQIDWLSQSDPWWNTAEFLPENSLIGQFLAVLLGYQDTPGQWQVISYFAALLGCVSALGASRFKRKFHS